MRNLNSPFKLAAGLGFLGVSAVLGIRFFSTLNEPSSNGTPESKLISNYVVQGSSMEPLFSKGQVISLDSFDSKKGIESLKRDSAVVIHGQGRGLLIKRIAAIPGDSFELRPKGKEYGSELLVNGQPFGLTPGAAVPRRFTPSLTVKLERLVKYYHGKIPPDLVLALGLSQDSFDSVYFGLLGVEDILGVVR